MITDPSPQPQEDVEKPENWVEADGLHDVIQKLCNLAGVALEPGWCLEDWKTIGALDDVRFALWRAYSGKQEDAAKARHEIMQNETYPQRYVDALNSEIANLRGENAQLKAEVERLREELGKALPLIDTHYSEVKRLRGEVEQRKRDYVYLVDESRRQQDDLRARIAQLESGWVRVEERLPEEGHKIMQNETYPQRYVDALNAVIFELRKDKARIDRIEQETRGSHTGVGFDYLKRGEERGYRFMRHHYLGERRPTLREVIDDTLPPAPETQEEKR